MAKQDSQKTAGVVPGALPSDNPPPPPGGGRWRFDITKPGWVDLDAANTPAAPAFPALPTH